MDDDTEMSDIEPAFKEEDGGKREHSDCGNNDRELQGYSWAVLASLVGILNGPVFSFA